MQDSGMLYDMSAIGIEWIYSMSEGERGLMIPIGVWFSFLKVSCGCSVVFDERV